MNQVALNLNTMTAIEKAIFAQNVGDALVANEATFPDQPVAGADLIDFALAVNTALTDAEAAWANWREMIAAQNNMIATLDNFLRQTAIYVGAVAQGDAATIELARLNVRKPASHVGQLPAPVGLIVKTTQSPGTVSLRWARVRKARSYIVQYAAGNTLPATFPNETPVTRARLDVKHLQSATRYWFRVAAIGTAGPSQWTDPVSAVTQ
jgi:hypothetical protein